MAFNEEELAKEIQKAQEYCDMVSAQRIRQEVAQLQDELDELMQLMGCGHFKYNADSEEKMEVVREIVRHEIRMEMLVAMLHPKEEAMIEEDYSYSAPTPTVVSEMDAIIRSIRCMDIRK
jgi:NADH:ubiquinone oxidoreductase subunit C